MKAFKPNISNHFMISHDVTTGVKDQANADSSKHKIYNLLEIKKCGLLNDLIKNALRTGNFDGVDDKIRELVSPFLYNGGQGKRIPVSTLVRFRNRDRPANKRIPADTTPGTPAGQVMRESNNFRARAAYHIERFTRFFKRHRKVSNATCFKEVVYREVCWKIEERGSVGETVLHICYLASNPVFFELAKRLVKIFPKMANDIYLTDEYYGENVLHMAIVNEDISMVKFLLDNGANIHERAIGKFFCADDQKEERIDRLENEVYELPIETTYEGHVYWGEYPLSFAACLELSDCYRLLLAKGANPNMQDTNGNTVLHMAVINMFALAYELGSDLHICNRQNLAPLALAAKLTRAELFKYILKLEREIFWQFCDVAFASYPIDEIDSIDVHTGEINKTSALSVVVFGEELGHLELFDGLLAEMLLEKWNTFARQKFFKKIKIFSLYFIVTCIAFLTRPGPRIPSKMGAQNSSALTNFCDTDIDLGEYMTSQALNCSDSACFYSNNVTGNAVNNVSMDGPFDQCYLLAFVTQTEKVCRVSEVLTLIGAILYLTSLCKEGQNLGLQTLLETLRMEPGRVMFIISCGFIVAMLPLRLNCMPRYEDRLASGAMFLTPMYFLFFCRGFRAVGPFVVMIYKMIISDLLCFVLIYMIFVLGFAEAYYVIFLSHNGNGTNYFSGVTDSILSMFLMSLTEFSDIYNEFDKTNHPFAAKFLFIVYMILVSVLLVAMLIAMMGKTYQDIASRPKEWLRQWARIVLIVERGLSKKERLAFQQKYSIIRDEKRVFIVKWETTDEDKKEIKHMKHLKAENFRNNLKFQATFSRKSKDSL